jgi:hypothetical protein
VVTKKLAEVGQGGGLLYYAGWPIGAPMHRYLRQQIRGVEAGTPPASWNLFCLTLDNGIQKYFPIVMKNWAQLRTSVEF